MKHILSKLALIATTIMAAAVPEERAWALVSERDIDFSKVTIIPLEVTDERFGGKTFSGSAESIYNEMKELKPELFVNETAEISLELESRSLVKREGEICCSSSCWDGKYTAAANCREGLGYLARLGSASCSVPAAPWCARVSCSHGCGMFLCNNLNTQLSVWCGHIGQDVAAIMNKCRTDVFGDVRGRRSFSSHFIGVSQDWTHGC